MLDWIQSNLAVFSGVFVPLLLGLIKPLIERDAGGRELRRIKRDAQLRGMLPEGDLTTALDTLLVTEIEVYAEHRVRKIGRKLNSGNLIAIILVSLLGGLLSFALVTWAQAMSGFWAWILWILFGTWVIFILLFVFVGGFSNLYENSSDKSDKKDEGKSGE